MRFDDNIILAAAYLFEKAHGRELEKSEVDEIERANLAGIDASELAERLVKFVRNENGLSPELRGAAYCALGKRYDPELRDFFREALAVEVKVDTRVAYQIMIALDNLNEQVFD